MTLSTIRQSANGFSNWIMLDYHITGFGVGLGTMPSSNSNITYNVEHTFDDITATQPCSVTRSGTTATLNSPVNHGLAVSDWISVQGTGSSNLDGQFAVAGVTDQNNITYTVANSGATASSGGCRYGSARIFQHAYLTALVSLNGSNRGNGNYTFPPFASRINITTYTAGYVDLNVIQMGSNR